MKSRLSFWLGLGLASSAWLQSGEPDFVALFNGKNLDGWDGPPGAWEVRNGEIWCTGKSSEKNWLVWRKEQPVNFILRLDFRWEQGNSGVQVRSDDLGKWQIFGYQVEIAHKDVMGLWHHSLLPADHPKKRERHKMATAGESVVLSADGKKTVEAQADPRQLKQHYVEHEWNTLEIFVKDDTLTQRINGVVFSSVVDRDAEMSRRKGFIAFQDHGRNCVVGFRNIRLRILE